MTRNGYKFLVNNFSLATDQLLLINLELTAHKDATFDARFSDSMPPNLKSLVLYSTSGSYNCCVYPQYLPKSLTSLDRINTPQLYIDYDHMFELLPNLISMSGVYIPPIIPKLDLSWQIYTH